VKKGKKLYHPWDGTPTLRPKKNDFWDGCGRRIRYASTPQCDLV